MAEFYVSGEELIRLQKAMEQYSGNVEDIINDVLHNQAGVLLTEEIRKLMPESKRSWKGKKAPAKTGNSLMIVNGNLSVTVKTTKNYRYLYFPDDGSNTIKHVGNQQFFLHGGENQTEEIINRCEIRLVEAFEETL